MPQFPLVRLLAPLLLLATGCGASADVVATYETHIGQRIIEAGAGGWGRIEERHRGVATPPDFYTLTTPEGRNLAVMRRGDGWIVADSADHSAWLNRDQPVPAPRLERGRFVESGPEKIGAWTGTGYHMPTGPCGSWSRFVVMRGPGLEAFGRMIRRNLLAAAKDRGAPACELQAIDLMGSGLLLWVDDPEARLARLERRRIDPERFRPPSPILTRAELFRLLAADSPGSEVIVAPTRQDPPR